MKTTAPKRNLIDEVLDAEEDRNSQARRQYAEVCARAENPRDGDTELLEGARKLLGRSPRDFLLDVDACTKAAAASQRMKDAQAVLADKKAIARLSAIGNCPAPGVTIQHVTQAKGELADLMRNILPLVIERENILSTRSAAGRAEVEAAREIRQLHLSHPFAFAPEVVDAEPPAPQLGFKGRTMIDEMDGLSDEKLRELAEEVEEPMPHNPTLTAQRAAAKLRERANAKAQEAREISPEMEKLIASRAARRERERRAMEEMNRIDARERAAMAAQ